MKELITAISILFTLFVLVNVGLQIIAYMLLLTLIIILAGVAIFHAYRIGYCTNYPDDEE